MFDANQSGGEGRLGRRWPNHEWKPGFLWLSYRSKERRGMDPSPVFTQLVSKMDRAGSNATYADQ